MRIRILIAACILLLAVFGAAIAEERYDYTRDTRAYCRAVARLNESLMSAPQANDAKARAGAQSALVLFKTENTHIDFDKAPFETLCAVYGPRGFSVLLCDEPEEAVSWLLSQDGVRLAEIDATVAGCSACEGAYEIEFHSWGAQALQMDAYAGFAAAWGEGSATVAVVDSGVGRHSLINGRIQSYGYDYVDNDADPSNDLNGHGTRVAGIVADCTQGLPVYVYPVRVLDANANGKLSNVISGVLEATQAHVDVINLSLSTFAESQMLEEAIRQAVSAGITVVAAAGNYDCDASEVTPAKMTDAGVIVVGSAEADGSRSSYSNYGESVDVYVYGSNISCCSRSGGYVADTGTSMAAPHVSALSAMIRLVHPGAQPAGIEHRIKTVSRGSVNVPLVSDMVPESLGFMLSGVTLPLGENLSLPEKARPQSALEAISYTVSDEAVLRVSSGRLVPVSAGSATVTVRCTGFEDSVFTVTVTQGEQGVLALPAGISGIGARAFAGICTDKVVLPEGARFIGLNAFDGGSIAFISIPDSVEQIGDNAFSGAVILCGENSFAQAYAVENGLQYINVIP